MSKQITWMHIESSPFTEINVLTSFPEIPIPTWASCIIPTSFAPSPIANVTGSGTTWCRTNLTSCAYRKIKEKWLDWISLQFVGDKNEIQRENFVYLNVDSLTFCRGVTRHAITASHWLAMLNISSSNSLSPCKCANAAPSITRAFILYFF